MIAIETVRNIFNSIECWLDKVVPSSVATPHLHPWFKLQSYTFVRTFSDEQIIGTHVNKVHCQGQSKSSLKYVLKNKMCVLLQFHPDWVLK